MSFFDFVQSADMSAVRFIREHLSCAFLDFVMPIITLLGEGGIFWICVTVCMLFFKKTRRAGFVMGLSLVLGFIVGNLTLKPLVARPRPYSVDINVHLLINTLSDYSFPSGHTLCCFEAAVSLILCGYKRWGNTALVFAFLVAFSRLYLYVHYPTDVIAGAIFGSIFAVASFVIVKKIYTKIEK